MFYNLHIYKILIVLLNICFIMIKTTDTSFLLVNIKLKGGESVKV